MVSRLKSYEDILESETEFCFLKCLHYELLEIFFMVVGIKYQDTAR